MSFVYAPPPSARLIPIYQDDDLLVLDKPAGLLSVPGRLLEHRDCLVTRAEAQFGPLHIVHRLDMDTSGLILFARTKQAQSALGRALQHKQIEKRYRAELSAPLPGLCGVIDLPLICDWPNRPRQKVCLEHGKPSQTRWRANDNRRKSVELTPITGRSHQLRVHLAALNAPILGDPLYNGAPSNRMHLHAELLRLNHPTQRHSLELRCPADF